LLQERIIATSLAKPKYRADIDGLRGIAVLSVVCFHAFPGWVGGGFIGVDIFFVISGFLISTIIFESLQQNRFSFLEFYVRRINRIFPALTVVMAACLIVGWCVLLPDEYKQLGMHVLGGSAFLSNFLLWNESGYFDVAAQTKPLLHLWSLGIEEQFYLTWPILLYAAWKTRLNQIVIIALIAVASFLLNVTHVNADATATFYSPQSRFWELLTGSLLAYLNLFEARSGRIAVLFNFPALSLLGATLISLSLFLLSKNSVFPGWWALLPTLGTALIILSGQNAWLNRHFLSNRLLVWFGLISFPLYLWHWPLLTIARIYDGYLSRGVRVALVVISVVFAWLTYKILEKRIRFGGNARLKALCLFLLMSIIGFGGYFLYMRDGFEGAGWRTPEKSEFMAYFENSLPKWNYFETQGIVEKYRFDCNFFDFAKYRRGVTAQIPVSQINSTCYTRDPSKKRSVLIWGDSHAQALYYGLNNNIPDDWQVLIIASSACAANIDIEQDSQNNYCDKSNWFAHKIIKDIKPDVVIVAQAFDHDYAKFKRIASSLNRVGSRALLVGPVPKWTTDLPRTIVRKLWDVDSDRTFVNLMETTHKSNEDLKLKFASNKDFRFVSLIDFFCNDRGCLTRIGNDRREGIISWDYGHLTPVASDFLGKNLLASAVLSAAAK
jgi:peptidoglycan/LPS O-acetylase OafA/YrhL